MIHIDNLNLRLPTGFESRANNIAQQTAKYLSQYSLDRSVTLDSLDMPNIVIQGGEANGVIARRIALSIHQSISNQSNSTVGTHSNDD